MTWKEVVALLKRVYGGNEGAKSVPHGSEQVPPKAGELESVPSAAAHPRLTLASRSAGATS